MKTEFEKELDKRLINGYYNPKSDEAFKEGARFGKELTLKEVLAFAEENLAYGIKIKKESKALSHPHIHGGILISEMFVKAIKNKLETK